MKNKILFIHIFFLLLPVTQYANNWRDTCFITNMLVTPDVKSGDIMGVKIDFDSFFAYDTKHKKKEPLNFIVEITILNEAGKPLPAVGEGSDFNRKGFVVTEKTEIISSVGKKVTKHFFIPYYCFDLPPGSAKLKFNIKISVRDSSISENERSIIVNAVATESFNINKPPTLKARLLCTGVKIAATNKGNSWDFGLSGLPDPVFKVILYNNVQYDIIYTSTEMQNSLSAAWIDASPVVIISEGDKITLGIYDNDTLNDDLIGSESHTIDEWIEITKTAKVLAFGEVKYCTVRVERVR